MSKTNRFWKPKAKAVAEQPVTRESLQREYTQACCEYGDICFKTLEMERRKRELEATRRDLQTKLNEFEASELVRRSGELKKAALSNAVTKIPTAPPRPDEEVTPGNA